MRTAERMVSLEPMFFFLNVVIRVSWFLIYAYLFYVCCCKTKVYEFELTLVIVCWKPNAYVIKLEIVIYASNRMELFDQCQELNANLTHRLQRELFGMPLEIIFQRLTILCHYKAWLLHECALFDKFRKIL